MTEQQPPEVYLVGAIVEVLASGPHYRKRGTVLSERGPWLDVYVFGSGAAPPVAVRAGQVRVIELLVLTDDQS